MIDILSRKRLFLKNGEGPFIRHQRRAGLFRQRALRSSLALLATLGAPTAPANLQAAADASPCAAPANAAVTEEAPATAAAPVEPRGAAPAPPAPLPASTGAGLPGVFDITNGFGTSPLGFDMIGGFGGRRHHFADGILGFSPFEFKTFRSAQLTSTMISSLYKGFVDKPLKKKGAKRSTNWLKLMADEKQRWAKDKRRIKTTIARALKPFVADPSELFGRLAPHLPNSPFLVGGVQPDGSLILRWAMFLSTTGKPKHPAFATLLFPEFVVVPSDHVRVKGGGRLEVIEEAAPTGDNQLKINIAREYIQKLYRSSHSQQRKEAEALARCSVDEVLERMKLENSRLLKKLKHQTTWNFARMHRRHNVTTPYRVFIHRLQNLLKSFATGSKVDSLMEAKRGRIISAVQHLKSNHNSTNFTMKTVLPSNRNVGVVKTSLLSLSVGAETPVFIRYGVNDAKPDWLNYAINNATYEK